MSKKRTHNLSSTYVRLQHDLSAEPLTVDDTFWQRLMAGQLGSFHNEYLITANAFEADWCTWEMHPRGDEIVCLLSGSVVFILETETGNQTIELSEAGEFVIVPKGTWHTARIKQPARMLFITPGEDTRHRDVVLS